MLKLKDLNTVLEPCENRLVYIYKRHIGGPPQFLSDPYCFLQRYRHSKSEPGKTPNEILESRILFMYEETFMHEEVAISDEIYGLAIIVHLDSKEVYE